MAADLLVKNTWYVAGLAHEFPRQQLQGQIIAEKPLVIWRTTAGGVVAFDERCRHKRMPLSQGRLVDGGLLECAYHGLCYDGTGQCVRVPSYPDGHIPREARLHPFPVIEQDVLVWIWPGDPAKRLTENELSDFSQLWHDSCSKAIIEAQDVDRNHSTEVCARGTALRKRCHGCGMEYNLYD